MTIHLTRARPYAKAVFSLALECDQLSLWQETLDMLAAIAKECGENKLLDNPKIKASEKIDFFADIIGQVPVVISNLVKLLVGRKKLFLLPAIAASYQQLLFAHNNILEAKIISAGELDVEQKEQLLKALKQRYQREILLACHVDPALIGGAVIYVADKVIDGSIRGMLQRLKQNLLLKSAYAKTE
jgi:F-type H+-transporting ATPase subunit delta